MDCASLALRLRVIMALGSGFDRGLVGVGLAVGVRAQCGVGGLVLCCPWGCKYVIAHRPARIEV